MIQRSILFEILNHYQIFHASNRDFVPGASRGQQTIMLKLHKYTHRHVGAVCAVDNMTIETLGFNIILIPQRLYFSPLLHTCTFDFSIGYTATIQAL